MKNDIIHISRGNSKLGKFIPIFSLPPHVTCSNATPLCTKYCYSNKAWRQYPRVRETRNKNFIASMQDDFVDRMVEKIQYMNIMVFRVHESGDFYSNEYLQKWFEIVRRIPNIKFFAWSKAWNLDWSEKPGNFIVYWSIWPDSKDIPKEGNFAYVEDSDNEEFDYEIPDGFHCPYPEKTCDICMFCFRNIPKVIIFKRH